jgi:hypothetical protein
MGVNGNPRVRVTAVIGDTSKKRAWKAVFDADKESDRGGKQSESLAEREAFERRIENDLGFHLAV